MNYRPDGQNLSRDEIKAIKRAEAEERQTYFDSLSFDQKSERNSTRWLQRQEKRDDSKD